MFRTSAGFGTDAIASLFVKARFPMRADPICDTFVWMQMQEVWIGQYKEF